MRVALAGLSCLAALLILSIPASAAQPLQVGVGRADITPPTGYYMMGWVRSDGKVIGQNTRLWARVIVLQEGSRKVALVAEDLNGIPGGMMAAAAKRDGKLGFSQRNVLDSASHTHAAPTGFYNFPTYNTVFMTLNSPTDFDLGGTLDPKLYAQDPKGVIHTIDPQVNVLRVDKTIGGRDVPVGMWSTFADHGTVNKFQFPDHGQPLRAHLEALPPAAVARA